LKPITDLIALSAFSGTLGTLTMYLFSIPAYFLKFTKIIYLLYTSEFFISPSIARSAPGFIMGFFTGIIAGCGLNLLFILLIRRTGHEWYWLKTLVYGPFIWFFWVGMMRHFFHIALYIDTDLRTNLILLLESMIFSLSAAFYTMKLVGGKERIMGK
jgi:hypothetical protein